MVAGIDAIATGSEAVHYFCSYGVLAIFLQVLIAVDGEGRISTSESGARRIATASVLQHAAIAAAADGRLGPPGRLIVVDAEHGEQTWRWSGDAPVAGGGGCGGALDWLSRP